MQMLQRIIFILFIVEIKKLKRIEIVNQNILSYKYIGSQLDDHFYILRLIVY